MLNKKLIEILSRFPLDCPVYITDGFECKTYSLDNSEIIPFEDDDNILTIDIGIGGCQIVD